MGHLKKTILVLICLVAVYGIISDVQANRSGCHKAHSCPSDTGSYTCGDLGYCGQCPDNDFCYHQQPKTKDATSTVTGTENESSTSTIGQKPTKSMDCILGRYPDKACTPGAIFPTATKEEVCQKGYTATVRNVSTETKNKVYAEYGVFSHKTGEYEVDHFVSLELGGSNDIANLFPEAADPKPGFHEKDLVENYLHEQVCDGKMTLRQAQEAIASDWLKVFQAMPQ